MSNELTHLYGVPRSTYCGDMDRHSFDILPPASSDRTHYMEMDFYFLCWERE